MNPAAGLSVVYASRRGLLLLVGSTALLSGCGPEATERDKTPSTTAQVAGTALMLRDTTITSTFDAPGLAAPLQEATVSTKLMGTVTDVLVMAGDQVRTGQSLVRIDARDLTAKATQVAATIADAEAMQKEALAHANRFRALYADSAATRVQFEAAETGLLRAEAGLRAARAGAAEIDAVRSYATVVAPFAGVITRRHADPGSFAAPGAPLVTVQDISALRLSASVPGDVIRQLKKGQPIDAMVDGILFPVRIEGILPSGVGNLYTVNALLKAPGGVVLPGSAVTLRLPTGTRRALIIPRTTLVHDGDLTGVVVRSATGDERRWIRVSDATASQVEVTGGLNAGETIVRPAPSTGR